jgi:hypothetical protein
VRLTEFDVEFKDGFVNRLTKETTSFFFTNYPVDTPVMDLWKMFARFGRVGEVYIPQKLDKQGHKFGFVKFKEVQDVEELNRRLGDIWMGTYHLRINPSRFGRNKKKSNSPPRASDLPPRRRSDTLAQPNRSFRTALVGETSTVLPAAPIVEETAGIPILDLEVEENLLQTLLGSYVGRLKPGVEMRALHMKINMAGLQAVKATTMGGGLVLLSRSAKTAVGAPLNNLEWWDSLLVELTPWTPNLVCKRRKLWLRLYGVPLHVWGTYTFKSIAERCGEFIAMDSGTLNRSRFDVARVQIESHLQGFIDFVIKLRVHGAFYKVRVVEEGLGPREVEGMIVEDQMGWSVAESSCFSGGGEPAFAVLEGLDVDESDCDASETCQQVCVQKGQSYAESTDGIRILENRVEMPLDNTTQKTSIPSIVEKVMETNEEHVSGDSSGDLGPRLLVDSEMCGQMEVGPVLGGEEVPNSHLVEIGAFGRGPIVEGGKQTLGLQEPILVDTTSDGSDVNRVCDKGQSCNSPLIDKFDNLVQKARGKHPPLIVSSLSEEQSQHFANLPQNSPIPSTKIPRSRKQNLCVPFPEMAGHKCLRFMGAINGGPWPLRRKKTKGSGSAASSSHISGSNGSSDDLSGEGEGSEEVNSEGTNLMHQDRPGIELSVVLPLQNPSVAQSGVRALLNDDSLLDVDGFLESRNDPVVKLQEAEKLIQVQQELGICFDSNIPIPTDHLVCMEERDRGELANWQESDGPQ